MKSPPEGVKELLVISHTHWDREWYRTFQQYRLQLLNVLDQLLELMQAGPEFKYFLLDGQTIILDDYLALRPERAAEVRRLVAGGRLQVGPWYVQPDESLVSGEALIRNLLVGQQAGEKLGGVTKVGWLPDTFGHIAQLPQILRNFEIDNFIFSRGLGEETLACPSAFWWRAPNGACVLALHQLGGYWNAGNLGYPCFWGSTEGQIPYPDRARQTARDLIAKLDPGDLLPALAVWNGADHTPPQGDVPQMIAQLEGHLAGYHARHGSVADYLAILRSDGSRLSTLEGELRGSRYQPTPASTLSSRVYLKQANHHAQRLLQSYAEPAAALAWLLGSTYPAAELREAWRLLLQNHSHDAICGCSIDPVYPEITSRFEQVEQIGQGLLDRAICQLSGHIDTAWCEAGQAPVLALNPLPRPRRETAQVTLRLPKRPKAVRVTDAGGQTGPAQIIACRQAQCDWLPRQAAAREVIDQMAVWRKYLRDLNGVDIRGYAWRRSGGQRTLKLWLGDPRGNSEREAEQLLAEIQQMPADAPLHLDTSYYEVSLAFQANTPALGYSTCAIIADDGAASGAPAMAHGRRALENEHLQVEVAPDGSLTVLHKETGQVYSGLGCFEDAGDAGDAYDFCPLPCPEGASSLSAAPKVTLVEAGPLQAALRLQWIFKIPESLTASRQARSARRVSLPVTSLVRLQAGSPFVEISTTIDNRARDHRLRVRFLAGLSSGQIHAGSQFGSVSRPVRLPAGVDWVQPPSAVRNHITWFAADDDARGLAILSEGLYEHEACPCASGLTLALTLLRGVGWLSRGDLTTRQGHAGPALPVPGAQCLGLHEFRYAVLPYGGSSARACLPQIAAAFDAPLFTCPVPVQPGPLPPWQRLVSLEPEELAFSALKQVEAGDRLAFRFYNTVAARVRGRIRFGFAVSEAWQATAAEIPIRPIALDSAGFGCEIDVEGHEIVTLLLRPA